MAPFKSTQSYSVGKFLKTFRNRDSVGPDALNSLAVLGPITATGGNKYTPGDGYIYHAFINSMNAGPSGVFTQTAGRDTIDILIVAGGGGGGGGYYAGGGAGGGILEGTLPRHPPGARTVTVGAGGGGSPSNSGTAANGENSVFDTVIALGGGSGGSGPSTDDWGGSGGSGGGASFYAYPGIGTASPQPAPSDYTAYGNVSGASRTPAIPTPAPNDGAGGGGAGAAGIGTTGGDGQAFPIWTSSVIPILTPLNPVMGASNNTYAGGGGGSPNGTGGAGGGATAPAAAGSNYLGGGGSGTQTPGGAGGAGGDGIVLIRYSAT